VAITLGQMAQYSAEPGTRDDRLPDLLDLILYRNVAVMGIQLPDHFRCYPEFLAELTPLVTQGVVRYREEFIDGFGNLPASLPKLFDGSNRGKLIVRA
jgi:NADPH-dependent curcumin reductase CurA